VTDIHVRGDEQHQGTPRVAIGPITHRAKSEYVPPNVMGEDAPPEMRAFRSTNALQQFEASLPAHNSELAGLRPLLTSLAAGRSMGVADLDVGKMRSELAKAADVANVYAEEWRAHPRWYQTTAPGEGGGRRNGMDPRELAKGNSPLAKSVLDIGIQTNLATTVGGQALGYVSLDTRVARATVRPDSFTLYQSLPKSAAYQVVDYWPYIDDTGGALPGSATTGFSNVTSGTLATNSGTYSLQSINLKLMLDGRAVTLALMAQNSFVSINEQENANAALTVLGTADWLCYFGNPTLFPNQFTGLMSSTPTQNIFDFQAFYNTNAALQGWSTSQALYNMIYESAAVITSWGRFGRITHAMMTPTTAGALQSLVTTLLNQIVASPNSDARGIVVDGDLQGMRTRFGPIQFPMDMMITARDIPAQGQPRSNGTTPTTAVNPTPPVTVTVAASGAAFGPSNWGIGTGAPYTSGITRYWYAVASTDINMNESNLTWSSAVIAGNTISGSGAAVVTITGPVAADATAYRVFRSGAGGSTSTPFASGANSPTAVRYIGSVAANGSGAVTFVDANAVIPGSEKIFLLDLRAEDAALDYRYLLPLTRVELFAQNLYMPWAVCNISALRNRIPKFHGIIVNFTPDSPVWSPLGENF
jgi:hypothetical protein